MKLFWIYLISTLFAHASLMLFVWRDTDDLLMFGFLCLTAMGTAAMTHRAWTLHKTEDDE